MRWALGVRDSEQWLDPSREAEAEALIAECDGSFKAALDRYKYADRYPEPAEHYRDQAKPFLKSLNQRLTSKDWLIGDRRTMTDVAIFPFIRQFAAVDRPWFADNAGVHLNRWLEAQLEWPLFQKAMEKHPLWNYAAA